MTSITAIEDIRLSERAALFQGRDEQLRVVSVHPSPTVQQTDL
jgi:hypothetical protein